MSDVTKNFEIKQRHSEANGTQQTLVEDPVDEKLPGATESAEPAAHDATVIQDSDDQQSGKRPLYKRPAVHAVASIVLVIGAIIGVRYWTYARSHESTDDAFIDGHIIQISPKASGYVAKVYVTDNQQVKAGDLMVELDARDYEARLQQAKAALDAGLAKQNEARTNVSLTRATGAAIIQQTLATIAARSGVEVRWCRSASSQGKRVSRFSSFNSASKSRAGSRASAGRGSRGDTGEG